MKLRVLLVEDSADDAALMLRELARAGHSVEHGGVETGQELVTTLEGGDWDVVLADYALPSFGGLDALGIVRARRPELPFIIVSGVIGEETAVRAMKAGAQDYLTKAQLMRLAPAVEREVKEAAARRVHRQTAAALGASEQRFELFMNTVPAAAWIKDEALRYVFGNQAFLDLTGRNEIVGQDDYALWPRVAADRFVTANERQNRNTAKQRPCDENAVFWLHFVGFAFGPFAFGNFRLRWPTAFLGWWRRRWWFRRVTGHGRQR